MHGVVFFFVSVSMLCLYGVIHTISLIFNKNGNKRQWIRYSFAMGILSLGTALMAFMLMG
ncbi:hypothetical protein [Halalkalibacterium ligniniphilum]|uniref:hypothetical protein n=1 Tax=Halalkalibacterium ligniniphilum TaxID=1134413 RepID=UPI000347FEAA|nr:hypothetical protein [Halalkalibacterium ligniniphilum]